MSENKKFFIVPDYVAVQDKECIHYWKMWAAVSYKIDNHPHRVFVAAHPKSGKIREFDCKAPIGIIKKAAIKWGARKEDIESIELWARELQALKNQKGALNALWSRKVFGKGRGDKNLLSMRSAEVIEMFGKYYTAEEIRRVIQEKWQFSIRASELQEFFNKYRDKIDKLRADYVLAGKETRLATDAGRLEILSKIAWEMEQKFDSTKSIDVSKELRATIEQIRKEVKGEEIKLTIDGKIDINATIQANQTIHEALQKLPINMIVIGLTAAKQGINPAQIIGSLVNSYYSKFNGFNKTHEKQELQLPGQYIKSYNWEEIRLKNEGQVVDVEPIEVYEEALKPIQKAVLEDKKSKMLELLKGLKEDMSDDN